MAKCDIKIEQRAWSLKSKLHFAATNLNKCNFDVFTQFKLKLFLFDFTTFPELLVLSGPVGHGFCLTRCVLYVSTRL